MVSPISNASGRVAMPPPLSPEDAFKKTDSTNKGCITESDLASAIVQFSPEGINLSQADAESAAKEVFAKMDADSDGKVTQSEFTAAAPQRPADGSSSTGRPSGPPPPPPGGGQGGPGGAKGAAQASSSQSYDAADTNQDGTVSEMERLAYSSKQQASDATSTSATSSNAVGSYLLVASGN